ncbi:hypothetical protein [Candidatus Nitrosarchaeum limnium]|uniref:Uncharacterized protein n=1 Tax=Candidatus Nitrosarchaeum limnium BG20 TaxID=859192 RepID=S2ESA1_9ARCH|nr:hypothetical protein [Candidatus Nitrosarchaeum limnium]EPA05289.1 hypothetical protein BG20_I0126 [Candidatus Nitrosarchaeum limnium BG20]
MKTNFKKSKEHTHPKIEEVEKKFTQKEFEEYILKSGAIGSYMIFRSDKKEDELGIDDL